MSFIMSYRFIDSGRFSLRHAKIMSSGDQELTRSTVAVSGTRALVCPLTIAVEGNIGSGKSTFLEYCRSKPGIIAYPEPVGEWRNVNEVNLLVRDSQFLRLSYHIPHYLYTGNL